MKCRKSSSVLNRSFRLIQGALLLILGLFGNNVTADEFERCPGGSAYENLLYRGAQADVVWDGVRFAAAIRGKELAVSDDGLTWEQFVASPITDARVKELESFGGDLVLVQHAPGTFSAGTAFAGTSVNGAWRELYLPINMSRIELGRNEMVAFNGREVFHSRHAGAWNEVIAVSNNVSIYDFEYLDYFVVLGSGGLQAAVLEGFKVIEAAGEIEWARSIASNGNNYVVVGLNGNIAVSDDGSIWRRVRLEAVEGIELKKVSWANDRYIGLGRCGVIVESRDGYSWDVFQAAKPTTFYNVAYGNGVYVAIGSPNVAFGLRQFGVIVRRENGSDWEEIVVPCSVRKMITCKPGPAPAIELPGDWLESIPQDLRKHLDGGFEPGEARR